MVFAYRAAEHRDYFDKYSPHVLRRRDAFRTINLACYYDIHGSDRTDLLNAELLQIYGGIELANAARLAEGTDAEAARRMVQNAADSAALALQIVRGQVADLQEAGKSSTFKATKGGQKALELHDELTQIRQRAQDILRAN
jgi:hypothetical protein